MHDELTAVDIEKMRKELAWRETELMPRILEDVKTARAFGDLSENYEYKAAQCQPDPLSQADDRLRRGH